MMGFAIVILVSMDVIAQSKFVPTDALVTVFAPATTSHAIVTQDGPATTAPSMPAHEIAVIMVIASTEHVIARLVGPAKLVWRRLAHLIAIIKVIVLEEPAFATPNTPDVTAVFHNAPILVQELVLASI